MEREEEGSSGLGVTPVGFGLTVRVENSPKFSNLVGNNTGRGREEGALNFGLGSLRVAKNGKGRKGKSTFRGGNEEDFQQGLKEKEDEIPVREGRNRASSSSNPR